MFIGYGKKIYKVLSRDRIPHTFPDHEFPSCINCCAHFPNGTAGEVARAARSYRYTVPLWSRLPSAEYMHRAQPPPSMQIARRSLASRKKCVFISTVTLSLPFFVTRTLSLFRSLYTR